LPLFPSQTLLKTSRRLYGCRRICGQAKEAANSRKINLLGHHFKNPSESKIIPEEAPEHVSEFRHQSALPVVHDLSYFCLLLPRMPHHQLTGDLAARLSEWIGQLCMDYGWRLEHLTIHPEFLQWVVNVIPTVSVDHIMETAESDFRAILASFLT
jgi:hypothetical protein